MCTFFFQLKCVLWNLKSHEGRCMKMPEGLKFPRCLVWFSSVRIFSPYPWHICVNVLTRKNVMCAVNKVLASTIPSFCLAMLLLKTGWPLFKLVRLTYMTSALSHPFICLQPNYIQPLYWKLDLTCLHTIFWKTTFALACIALLDDMPKQVTWVVALLPQIIFQ